MLYSLASFGLFGAHWAVAGVFWRHSGVRLQVDKLAAVVLHFDGCVGGERGIWEVWWLRGCCIVVRAFRQSRCREVEYWKWALERRNRFRTRQGEFSHVINISLPRRRWNNAILTAAACRRGDRNIQYT